MMKRYFTALAIVAAATATLAAQQPQSLNSTVNITNDYQSQQIAASRYELAFAIPDSLMRFDYEFDYSVFDKPYKGAFEFSPYAVRLSPERTVPADGKLLVRAGAGYNLHPELQAVWKIVQRSGKAGAKDTTAAGAANRYSLFLYQDLHGYVGDYRTVRSDVTEQLPLATTRGVRHFGYDLAENFGVLSRLAIDKAEFGLDLGYSGIFTKDESRKVNYNALAVKLTSKTAEGADVKIVHDVTLSADLAADSFLHPFEGSVSYGEHNYVLSGYAGSRAIKQTRFSAGADFDLRYAARRREVGSAGYAKVTPKAMYCGDIVQASAGVGISGMSKLAISPEIDFRASFFKNTLSVYAGLTGGLKSNTYSSLKADNHWFYAGYTDKFLDTHEKLKAFAGLRGTIAQRFSYDLSGGWASTANDALWGVKLIGDQLQATLAYADYRKAFADLTLRWKSESVEADAQIHYTHFYAFTPNGAVMPAPLSGAAHATYNYRKRIYAGVDFEASAARDCSLPGHELQFQPWMDLGIHGEFVFSRKLSVWLRGRNLLCESIHKFPMHIENGPEVTVGVIFNL